MAQLAAQCFWPLGPLSLSFWPLGLLSLSLPLLQVIMRPFALAVVVTIVVAVAHELFFSFSVAGLHTMTLR